jgi:pyruvate-ferredoxin/flavodoxin oxidoreductase
MKILDGNEAAADVAYRASEVIAIYPITPASPMGELSDAWAAAERPNLWGDVPEVVEMQSEGGAAGAIHGALQAGALATTFTASQGLLLMLPNMFKIAGELTPAVIHVAARTVATHALSIFGDHSDVMAARTTGWAMLCSASPQEAHDLAAVAHAATLESRVPFLHFFDGFRTSHELNEVSLLSDDELKWLLDDDFVRAHRSRALDPDHPVVRGTAQNPDVFFQAREASNPYHDLTPRVVQEAMDRVAQRTGRALHLFDYEGHPQAERVVVVMGSGRSAVADAVRALNASGERVGMVQVRLYRPFDTEALVAALPSTVRAVAVLDRTKEPGAPGEPLFLDVAASIARSGRSVPVLIGGRYGLSSKELTPPMVTGAFKELDAPRPRHGFTVGIVDDVTHLSLPYDRAPIVERDGVFAAVCFGLGSDGTVGANKATAKIVGERTPRHVQGYFVYDSKKSGSMTISHLRFADEPVDAPWLVQQAQLVACHQFGFLDRVDVLAVAAPGAAVLLNSPYGPDEVWERLPREVQATILERHLRLFVIDAAAVSEDVGLGGIVSTVLQTCFFELAGLLPSPEAAVAIKAAIAGAYGSLGAEVMEANHRGVDVALHALHEVDVSSRVASGQPRTEVAVDGASAFERRVTAQIIAGRGELLPVSALPPDGTFPVGSAHLEKRGTAREIPSWDAGICIDCGKCAIVCPHAAIRMRLLDVDSLAGAPDTFLSKVPKDAGAPAGARLTVQVAPDDCTGCELCVHVCPAKDRDGDGHRALEMVAKLPVLERERASWAFLESVPEPTEGRPVPATVRAAQLRKPLFEFSGACAGCGETPYLKLLTQLVGDRLLVANATGCSSIYGANLPTTPWSADADGRGPAWANSLFEDNAEFGLGMRLAVDARRREAVHRLTRLVGTLGDELVRGILDADQTTEEGITAQRHRVVELRRRLEDVTEPDAIDLLVVADDLVERSVWIVGGDGWAYDIGFGGLDHVLSSGANVNVLVLDTEVYSNTGGQASKSTPRAAVAKFATSGKRTRKKDLGMIAAAYGDVYVAQVALGANDLQTLKAFNEAASWPGPSLILAYSHCIAHGIEMSEGMEHQRDAVRSGYWPLYRYDPRHAIAGDHPFRLDSKAPTLSFGEFARHESRFTLLAAANPAHAAELAERAQLDIDERWHLYEQEADVEHNA